MDVLSDTQGVDFGPYLKEVLVEVKKNWYRLIPESAVMKRGKLAIEFAITKGGNIADMRLMAIAGDTILDRQRGAASPLVIHSSHYLTNSPGDIWRYECASIQPRQR